MGTAQKKPVVRRSLDKVVRFTSTVGETTTFTGSFSGGENIVVRGRVIGESNVDGAVVITETGCWEGKLTANVVIVAGHFQGDITASEKIELLAGAKLTGDLTCPILAIENGAIHVGHLDMGKIAQVKHFQEKRNFPTGLLPE